MSLVSSNSIKTTLHWAAQILHEQIFPNQKSIERGTQIRIRSIGIENIFYNKFKTCNGYPNRAYPSFFSRFCRNTYEFICAVFINYFYMVFTASMNFQNILRNIWSVFSIDNLTLKIRTFFLGCAGVCCGVLQQKNCRDNSLRVFIQNVFIYLFTTKNYIHFYVNTALEEIYRLQTYFQRHSPKTKQHTNINLWTTSNKLFPL